MSSSETDSGWRSTRVQTGMDYCRRGAFGIGLGQSTGQCVQIHGAGRPGDRIGRSWASRGCVARRGHRHWNCTGSSAVGVRPVRAEGVAAGPKTQGSGIGLLLVPPRWLNSTAAGWRRLAPAVAGEAHSSCGSRSLTVRHPRPGPLGPCDNLTLPPRTRSVNRKRRSKTFSHRSPPRVRSCKRQKRRLQSSDPLRPKNRALPSRSLKFSSSSSK